ncbi:MAG: ureidoglycolate lyase [Alphaproteobacteria bacterium]|nr:ureidoglycolate lyase [Alphaproteobacteria bacterium]
MDIDIGKIAYPPTTGARRRFEVPVIEANAQTLRGYGDLVEGDPRDHAIEIVRWPAQGWRPIDPGSGDQGGVTEGEFAFWWRGQTLYARNRAVGDSYLFGWSDWPEVAATEGAPAPRDTALIWRANYHPDGGQLFHPLGEGAFIVPLALPGDDVTPDRFVAFRCQGRGLYIHPNVWHGALIPLEDEARFLDRQGRVHARVSVDFAKEFDGYLAVPLT